MVDLRRGGRIAHRLVGPRLAGDRPTSAPAEQSRTSRRRSCVGIWFIPGAVARRGWSGWFVDPARERRAGLVLPRLQPRLRRGDRRPTAGSVGRLLRVSLLVLLVYGGLLVLTYWVFAAAPTGLRPAAGPGPADRQRPAARLGVAAAHPGGRWRRSRRSPARRRAWPTRSPSRACRSCCRPTAPNFGSMFVVLDPFDEAAEPGPAATRPSWPGCGRSWAERGQGRAGHRVRRAADPRPGRRRRLQAHGRGPRRPRAGRPCSARPTT